MQWLMINFIEFFKQTNNFGQDWVLEIFKKIIQETVLIFSINLWIANLISIQV